jgi:hypothetical protein
MIGANARPLLVATALQSILAATLLARAVTFAPAPAPAAGVLGLLGGAGAGYALYRLLSLRDSGPPNYASVRAFAGLAVAYVAIAVAEEILWRGWAFGTLESSRGIPTALIVTTIGFALVHGIHQGYAGVRFHVATGLAFGLTFLATNSLAAAAAAHVTYNVAVLFGTVTTQKKARHDVLALG